MNTSDVFTFVTMIVEIILAVIVIIQFFDDRYGK